MKQTPQGLTINIRLTPKASRNAITGWAHDENGAPVLKASVTAVPEKGKANDALIALIAKQWHIPKSHISVLRGATDRNKTILLEGLSTLPPQAGTPDEAGRASPND